MNVRSDEAPGPGGEPARANCGKILLLQDATIGSRGNSRPFMGSPIWAVVRPHTRTTATDGPSKDTEAAIGQGSVCGEWASLAYRPSIWRTG